MGLSNAISGAIILFGVTYVMFIFAGFTDTTASITDVSSLKSDLESKLVKTSIDVTIESNPGTNAIFEFDITNTNSEKLWEFDKFDVIVTYVSDGRTSTQTLIYDSQCQPSIGEWCPLSWIDDVLDPEILNDGETLTVRVRLNSSITNNSDLIVIVSTPNGVVASDTVVV